MTSLAGIKNLWIKNFWMTGFYIFNCTFMFSPHSYLYIIVVPVPLDADGNPDSLDINPNDIRTEDLKAKARRRRSAEPRKRRVPASDSDTEPYIAAKLMGDKMPPSILIGDGTEINGYQNKPLKEGKYYVFFTRAVVLNENQVCKTFAHFQQAPIKSKFFVYEPHPQLWACGGKKSNCQSTTIVTTWTRAYPLVC